MQRLSGFRGLCYARSSDTRSGFRCRVSLLQLGDRRGTSTRQIEDLIRHLQKPKAELVHYKEFGLALIPQRYTLPIRLGHTNEVPDPNGFKARQTRTVTDGWNRARTIESYDMAYEDCPACGSHKHQLIKCPKCGFQRLRLHSEAKPDSKNVLSKLVKERPNKPTKAKGRSRKQPARQNYSKSELKKKISRLELIL